MKACQKCSLPDCTYESADILKKPARSKFYGSLQLTGDEVASSAHASLQINSVPRLSEGKQGSCTSASSHEELVPGEATNSSKAFHEEYLRQAGQGYKFQV